MTQQINSRNLSRCAKNKTGKIGVSRIERKSNLEHIRVEYIVTISDPDRILSGTKTYKQTYPVNAKQFNHLTGKHNDYFTKTEEETLAQAIAHRLYVEKKLGYTGE